MPQYMRAPCVAALAALMCALAVGSATASTLTLEPAGEFTMSGAATYSGEGVEVTCNLRVTGELERSIANAEREGSTLGQVSRQSASECAGGTLPTFLGLPWLIRFVRILRAPGFSGILYLIANETISFLIFGIGLCLYVGATGILWSYIGVPPRSGGAVNLGTSYTKFSGGPLCPLIIRRLVTFSVSPTQTASLR